MLRGVLLQKLEPGFQLFAFPGGAVRLETVTVAMPITSVGSPELMSVYSVAWPTCTTPSPARTLAAHFDTSFECDGASAKLRKRYRAEGAKDLPIPRPSRA
jgi:hypothetical protein